MSDLASLTREEAAARSGPVESSGTTSTSTCAGCTTATCWAATSTVSFTCREPGASTFVDCVGAGRLGDPERRRPSTRRPPSAAASPCPTSAPTTCWSSARSRATPPSGNAILRTVDPNDKLVYVWSTFEPDMARYAFACFDQPDLKAPHGFVVDAHESWTVTSNSAPDRVEDVDDGGRRWTFGDTPPLSTYVTVVNGGPVPRARGPRAAATTSACSAGSRSGSSSSATPRSCSTSPSAGCTFFGERFGQPFPQERYDQVFVPNMGGAMENWGSVTWTDSVLYRSTPDLRPARRPRRRSCCTRWPTCGSATW